MIGKITGTLTEYVGTNGLIETNSGVGYLVALPPSAFGKKLPVPFSIYTHHHVREDADLLFGFDSTDSLRMFHMVLSVSGVGPKTAYTVVSYASAGRLRDAVVHNDLSVFTSIPGLGKKTAMKIILELSGKLDKDFAFEKLHLDESDQSVMQALQALGYSAEEARKTVPEISKELPMEQRITEAIRALSRQIK
jgi:holliday junction DNA helicase RuvA